MLKNNLRLELETIHHDPRRQAGGMTKDSSANRPPNRIWKGLGASFVRYTAESLKTHEGQLFCGNIFFLKMRYYTSEKCNCGKLAKRIGKNEW